MGQVGGVRARQEQGFSLVELLVILVIIGILAAIGIVTYLNQRQTAHRASAISTLTNVHLTAESLRAEQGTTDYANAASVYNDEQDVYTFDDADPSTGPREVSVTGGDYEDGTWVAFAVSSGSRCFYLRLENGVPGVLKDADDAVPCVASGFPPGEDIGEWD